MARLTAATLLIAAAAVLSFTVYFQLNFQNGHIQGDSMSPTMNHGDRMVSQRWGKPIANGTIVVLTLPDHQHQLVKRVAGLPGQTVAKPLADQPTRLGPGQYWVIGDNMPISKDSRHFGPVTKENINGVVIHIRRMK